MVTEIINKIRYALDRAVPISDPQYIIGEEYNINIFNGWAENLIENKRGFSGALVLGQIGNGKTHFLRYVRGSYQEQLVGLYIPNMFISGPLVNVLNNIYKSIFYGSRSGNSSLKMLCPDLESILLKKKELLEINPVNEIFRYLSICSNIEEVELVLNYFSNNDIFPDSLAFLRKKFGAKKNFISNELDFAKATGDALEFVQVINNKPILLLIDEVDQVYSFETNSVCLTRVGAKVLTAYRTMFDHINTRDIHGLICIGATPEAWDVLSQQTAFERRFTNKTIKLKYPKSKTDCLNFLIARLEEINYHVTKQEENSIRELVAHISEEQLKTWADIISVLMSSEKETEVILTDNPNEEILDILNNSLMPLSWQEIVSKSALLNKLYPNSQPTQLLSRLKKDKKIRINNTRPATYEAFSNSEDPFDE